MLDEIDHKILIALVKDGRSSYIKLAKKLGIKPITVATRVNKMLEDDVFTIRAVPNPEKTGNMVLAFIGLDVKLSYLEEVCSKLIDISNISYVSTVFGKYDVILFAEYPNFNALYHLVTQEIPSIKGIKTIETFIISTSKQKYAGSFHIEPSPEKSRVIDEINEKIINELKEDGRTTYSVLASKLGISPATVHRRVDSLVKDKIIRIIAVANPTKLGHHVLAFLCLHVELDKVNEVFSRLLHYPQIPLVMTLINGYNIVAAITLPHLDSLFKFISSEISHIDGVSNTETLIRAEFRKRTYLGFDVEEMLRYSSVDDS